MIIDKDKVVGVHYQLKVEGTQLDASKDEPLVYMHGRGMMIPGFERQLEGLKEGDTYDFVVSAAEGYGEYNSEAVVDLDKSIFLIDGSMSADVFPGAQIRMSNEEGHPMMGVVQAINEDNVIMDFNHQLAGKELHFTGLIASIREATAEEISHGHVHGPGGHHH